MLAFVSTTAAQAEAAVPFHNTSGVIAAQGGANYINQVPDAMTLGEAGGGAVLPPEPTAGINGLPLLEVIVFAIAAGCSWLFFRRRWYCFDDAPLMPTLPESNARVSAALRLGLFVASMVLAQIGAAVTIAALALDPEQQPQVREMAIIGLGSYSGEMMVVAAFIMLAVKEERGAVAQRRMGRGRAALFGAGALLLFWPVLMTLVWLINLAVRLITGSVPDAVSHQTLVMLLGSQPGAWSIVLAVMAVVLAPIVEEVIYRGMLQSALVQLEIPRWGAIAGTSVVFVVMHIAAAPSAEALPGMLVALFVLSLGFGWIYEKTGSLIAPMVMHMLFNSGNLAAAVLLL